MNINNINAALKPVEPKLMDPKPMAPPLVDLDSPASEPNKSGVAEESKSNTRKMEEQKKNLSVEETRQMAEELNEYMDDLKTTLGFSIRENHMHEVIVEIKNRETDELIKQIPSEELLAIKGKIEEFTGLIFDQKV